MPPSTSPGQPSIDDPVGPESPPIATADGGLVQILDSQSIARGMGFLVSRHLVVTCAHVVNFALDPDMSATQALPQDAGITVTFPLAEDETVGEPPRRERPSRTARVLRFIPPGPLPGADIALLVLDRPAPESAGVSVLADIRTIDLEKDELGIFGAPTGGWLPIHFDARFGGKTRQSWVQVDDRAGQGAFATEGFSGGRVWSYQHRAALGMLVEKHISDALRTAFMISAAAIARALPEVLVEKRTIGANFCRNWTLYSVAMLLFYLTHFLANRIGEYPYWMSLGFGNEIVAAFFGALIGAVLLPIQMAALVRFATAFRLHPWWMRIPRLGRMTGVPQGTGGPIAALSILLFFALVPLYTQIFFLNQLRKGDTHVYIYSGSFGYSKDDLLAQGKCYDRPVTLCTHKQADLFGRVKPKPADPNAAPTAQPAAGPYFDNAYHIGNLDLKNPNTVTFFPIIEPVAMLLGTVLALVLAIWLVLLLMRPSAFDLPRPPST